MTALHQYSRLEAAGLWRSDPQAQRREVIVGLRTATIVLLDPKTDMPLAQWSLPAIVRVTQFQGFVVFASHEDGFETLEIDDAAMIAALDTVRGALDRRRKNPGRLRLVLTAAAALSAVGAIAIWVPLQFYEFAAQRLPDAARRDVAAMALRDIGTIAGSPCNGAMGLIAAQDLARRVAANAPPQLAILRTGLTAPSTLADGTIVLPYGMIETADGPDTLAGIVLAETLRSAQSDPLESALRHAGFMASAMLLSTGSLPKTAMDGYGLALIETANASPPVDSLALHGAFADAVITSQPYAAFAGNTALAQLPDTAPQGSMPIVLEDAAFLGLQYICDN
ncbi:MAG: hypothetical protein U5N55_06350 [Cypionkella sp.]|nr:hypothetical protein [Cypionkella sp.]